VSSTLGDRYSIQLRDRSNDNCSNQVALSPEWLVNCDSSNGGCNGGGLKSAFQFMKETGVTNESCLPYAVDKMANGQVNYNLNKYTSCPTDCENSDKISNKLYVDILTPTVNSVADMQKEI